ncbi:hypothetical protein HAN_1g59 (nucleomorph) [Hemiselmis andersenii]|uniref:Uncharacterized protein n=1 Tax=Hemiselmis andersenii TaxID=464988 RepID=A9BK71_HEMAN|nr:hypothetical protein HAN_1g59 [Hemiselmis andersenii]ABW97904.1 hypothetical protein HAN_1g59 [Hemiselmis andersenii]
MQIWDTKSFPNSNQNFKKVLNFTKKQTNLFGFSNDGNFLGIIIGKILGIWKIFPKFGKLKALNLCFDEEIVALKFFSFKKRQNFLIYSKNEFSIFNIDKNLLINKIKLTIVQLTTESWLGKFAGIIRFFFPKNFQKKQSIVVFKEFSLIPIFLIDSKIISTKNIVSFYFSYNKKKKKFGSLVIDSLLKFHKVYF